MKLSNFRIVAEHRSKLMGLLNARKALMHGGVTCEVSGYSGASDADLVGLLGGTAIKHAIGHLLDIEIGKVHGELRTYAVEIDE